MLRSKATAALLKLKEIDRKYKMKSSHEEVKLQVNSSLSDISITESGRDEISKHEANSGDKTLAKAIINTRPKLDIRMPEAYMERGTIRRENELEMVQVFDKPKIRSPTGSESIASPKMITRDEIDQDPLSLDPQTGEGNFSEVLPIRKSFENRSLMISEEHFGNTEASISEDVPEVVSSSHPVSNHLEADVSQEITLKSVDSIIDAEERVQSDLDEDPSTLVPSGTYSDDFVKTLSTENDAEDPNSSSGENPVEARAEVLEPESTTSDVKHVAGTLRGYQRQRSPELDNNSELETEDIEELVSPEVLDAGDETANSVHPLQRRSSESSSARSGKERHRRRRPHTSSSSRDSKSPESSSRSKQKKDSEITNASGTLNPTKNRLKSGRNSPETNRSKKVKGVKEPQTVPFLEVQKDQSEVDVDAISRSGEDEVVALKMKKSKNLKDSIRARDTWTEEPPPNYSKESKMHKCESKIKPVSVTVVGQASQFLKFSKTDEVGLRPEKRASKYRVIPRGQKRRSNKKRMEDSPRSKHKTKGGSHRESKNKIQEEPGIEYDARDVEKLMQQIKELRLLQERDQLRSRVRGYVLEMFNEQRILAANDGGFGGSIDELDRISTGLRQTENLRCFFKPLDLPNVAAFKRPDFDDRLQPADLDNERYLHLHMIRERVLGIRHFLKQQFILYRDYSDLVSTINAKYIPVTLKETKKMIRDMKRFYDMTVKEDFT